MSEEEGKKYFIVITEDGYTSEKSFAGLRFCLTALVQGHSVDVFLLGPGVINAIKGQEPDLGANMGEWLENILEEGGKIKTCGICCKKRGIKPDQLLDVAPIGSMGDLVESSAASDIQLTF